MFIRKKRRSTTFDTTNPPGMELYFTSTIQPISQVLMWRKTTDNGNLVIYQFERSTEYFICQKNWQLLQPHRSFDQHLIQDISELLKLLQLLFRQQGNHPFYN